MFDFAIKTAKELDRYYAENGAIKGPLHGLPVSLKDQFHVVGYDTTMGYVGWIGTYEGSRDPTKVHQVNSQIVNELLSLGAVLFCKVCGIQNRKFSVATDRLIKCFRRVFLKHWTYVRVTASAEACLASLLRSLFSLAKRSITSSVPP